MSPGPCGNTSAVSGTSGFLRFSVQPRIERHPICVRPNLGVFSGRESRCRAASDRKRQRHATRSRHDPERSGLERLFPGIPVWWQPDVLCNLSGSAVTNPDGTSVSGSTFGFGLYDGTQNPVLTVDPSGSAATIDLNLTGALRYTVSSASGGGPVVAAVQLPEPGTLGFVGVALFTLALMRRANAGGSVREFLKKMAAQPSKLI